MLFLGYYNEVRMQNNCICRYVAEIELYIGGATIDMVYYLKIF